MKYIEKLFVIVFFCFFSNLAYTETGIITYIDMDKIMNNSTAGKKFAKSLEESWAFDTCGASSAEFDSMPEDRLLLAIIVSGRVVVIVTST